MPPFTFDFSNKTVTYSKEPIPIVKVNRDRGNLCPYPVPTLDDIFKMIGSTYTISKDKLFSDICECGALAISNAVDLINQTEREERYKQIMKGYNPDDRKLMVDIFAKMFALLSSVVYDDGRFSDYLGELFMRCNIGNKNCGQFFTPYHISHMMASMIIGDNAKAIADRDEIISICDPCSGGGGMLMAGLDVLANEYKINYARNVFISAADIDIRCVHMTYLQLALAGVPAIVRHQNSLTMECWSVWKTPAFILQYPRFCKYESA